MPQPIPAGYTIQPLSAAHDRTAFSSGVEPLDIYFRRQASQDTRRRLTACFVASASDRSVAGYYTLSASGIELAQLPEDIRRRLPRYPSIPATLMGRLAVDQNHRRRGLGEFMLLDAFRRSLTSEIASFAFLVDAKDDGARTFYERYGFRRLEPGERRLYMPMAEIAALFG